MKLELSRRDTACLKGMAILCIILHNFLHLLRFTVKENEYTFNVAKSYKLWKHMLDFNPNLWADFISYFGHYGVPMFLFISGYGLVKKYESKDVQTSFATFARYNIIKLFKLMVIAYMLYLLIAKWNQGVDSIRVFAMLSFTGNLFYPPFLGFEGSPIADPGPYWYFSLTLQLYFLYYVLFRHCGKKSMIAIVALCCLVQAIYINDFATLNYIRYNFVGSVLPFCMGIWFSRYGVEIKKWYILPSLAIIALLVFTFNFMFGSMTMKQINALSGIEWLFIPPFFVMVYICLVKILPEKINSIFAWIGGISAAIFATHPIIRALILPETTLGNYVPMVLLYLVCCLAAGFIYSHVVKQLK